MLQTHMQQNSETHTHRRSTRTNTQANAIKNRTILAEVKTTVKGRPVSGYVAETDEIVQYTISERELVAPTDKTHGRVGDP